MGATAIRLEKALWTNIAELRLAESKRRRNLWIALSVVGAIAVVAILMLWLR